MLDQITHIARQTVGASTASLPQIAGESQSSADVAVRQVTAFLLRIEVGWSLPRIGRALGRDHSTVLYSVRRVQRMAAEDAAFAMTLVWAMDEARDIAAQPAALEAA